jgi:hypothetical protein
VSEKFAFIDAGKAQYRVVKMCTWLEVFTSGYCERRDRPALASAQRRGRLVMLIEAIFDESDRTYDYRRIHAVLVRQGEDCCSELVREVMRELGLVPCQPRGDIGSRVTGAHHQDTAVTQLSRVAVFVGMHMDDVGLELGGERRLAWALEAAHGHHYVVGLDPAIC